MKEQFGSDPHWGFTIFELRRWCRAAALGGALVPRGIFTKLEGRDGQEFLWMWNIASLIGEVYLQELEARNARGIENADVMNVPALKIPSGPLIFKSTGEMVVRCGGSEAEKNIYRVCPGEQGDEFVWARRAAWKREEISTLTDLRPLIGQYREMFE